MRRLIVTAAAIALVLPAPTAFAEPAGSSTGEATGANVPADLPSGAPPAARNAEPRLPAPDVWPFPESFSRTSGTGRLDAGAMYWSGFVYDDHGAAGIRVSPPVSTFAIADGTYVYPSGAAYNNGADIFRAAVGMTETATYWRVDWTTLTDPSVPVAEWTFDTDSDVDTGVAAWPAGAGVRSPGIDIALVVSSKGARLLDAASGEVLAQLPTHVDLAARSFVVRIPRGVLDVSGSWRIRLASGLANEAGAGFADVPAIRGAAPSQPAVYNVTFRNVDQEPPVYGEVPASEIGLLRGGKYGNFWMEDHQAEALAAGDVSEFSHQIDWSKLASEVTTPEPLPVGYSNRWYVTGIDPEGEGVVDGGLQESDLDPNYLSRIQPYAVYVPPGYDPTDPAPLTWVLHSLGGNHNQYGGLAPDTLDKLCAERGSICATTLGFGPDGWYYGEAEVDFWSVWRELAQAYSLDTERTVISGYSMGGWASYKLGLTYPDLFAGAMSLAGPPVCGARLVEGARLPLGSGRCQTDGNTTPLVGNARWLPYVIAHGALDELVPVTSVLEQVHAFDKRGYRYHFELYPVEDHIVYATQDGFSTLIEALGTPKRTRRPGHITYTWYPRWEREQLGIGPTGPYWIEGIEARDQSPGSLASFDVRSHAIPDAKRTVRRSSSLLIPGDPTPAVMRELTWHLGATPASKALITLDLSNVESLGVDTDRAGFKCGRVEARSDGPSAIRLLNLAPGTPVYLGGQLVTRADDTGTAVLRAVKGTTTFRVCRAG